MTHTSHRAMDEPDARRVLLAHAIETTDAKGELLTPAERATADLRARQEVLHRADGRDIDAAGFLALRSSHVLGAVGVRHPRLAALQEPAAWLPWVHWAVPLAALALGIATDAIGNPHRVDLVSLPLLGIVAWNVVVYLLVVASLIAPRRAGRRSWLASFGRWTTGRGSSDPASQAATRFHIDWFAATQSLHVARIQRVLHISAAAWALGVILSLLVRGLVVEYRVGWESTFLGPQQVYSILSVLRLPALLIFPFDTFSVVDVAEMRFGDGGGAAVGAPWVWMYAALLVSLVILPRLLLATFCAWREERLARAIPVELQPAYAERVESLMSAASFRLGVLAHRPEDREMFILLLPARDSLPEVVSSPAGDVMRIVDVPVDTPAAPAETPQPWWSRWWPRSWAFTGAPDAAPRNDWDVLVHLVREDGDAARAASVLSTPESPVVTIALAGERQGLPIGDLQRPVVGDRLLLDAIAAALPEARRTAFAQIVREWESMVDARTHRAMTLIAGQALFAAAQVEEVMAGNLSVRSLLPAERDAQARAREAAMARVAQRLDESARAGATQLRALLGVDASGGEAIEHRLEERFTVQQPVDAPQAGIAGAASGAAMGASIDLLAGGLTLGAAAALGALVGGGAAYIAAAWKNRSSPTGATLLQLSDEMLDALLEAALLRYVAMAHWARGRRTIDDAWRAEIATRVRERRAPLAGYWNSARTKPDAQEKLSQALAQELGAMVRALFTHAA